MNRFVYFIRQLKIQIPMIWRATGHYHYFYRHLHADDKKSENHLRKLLKPIDREVKLNE